MITRRKLFALLAAGGTLAAVESLLPTTTIFLPPAGGWPPLAYKSIERFPIQRFETVEVGSGVYEHQMVGLFVDSREHVRRKKRLDCIDGQMVWIPV